MKILLLGSLMSITSMQAAPQFQISSLDFVADQKIPKAFTGEGSNKAPRLAWKNAPENTKSFALIMDDPDAPAGTWVHWIVYNIAADTSNLDYIQDRSETLKDGTMQGTNSWPKVGYDGPMPPKGHGVHHYYFKIYALDTKLNLKPKATKQELLNAMNGHILAQSQIIGIYERPA